MKTTNKIYALLVVMMAGMATVQTTAQELRSSYFMKTSNFRHQINPALLDHAYVGLPLFGNVNIGTSGNAGLTNFVYQQGDLSDGYSLKSGYNLTTFMNPGVSADKFLGDLDDVTRLNADASINLFSVAFKSFGGISLVEMNVKSSTSLRVPKELFEFMKETGTKEEYLIEDLGVRSSSYAELVFGHSRALNDKWTVGAKLKFLMGLSYADFDVNQMKITMNGDAWQVESDAEFTAAVLKSNFKYEDASKTNAQGQKRVKGLEDVSFGLPGFGMAVDFGATYKAMDGLMLSGAVTDLGWITWSGAKKAKSSGNYTFDGFDDILTSGNNHGNKLGDQFSDLGDDLEEMFSVYDQGKENTSGGLACSVNLGAEYEMPFYRNLSAGLLYTSKIYGKYSWHQAMLSANVRPLKWLEISLNTSASTFGWNLGGMLSVGAKGCNFFIGSDRFMGKTSKEWIPLNSGNMDFSFGLSFPLS